MIATAADNIKNKWGCGDGIALPDGKGGPDERGVHARASVCVESSRITR